MKSPDTLRDQLTLAIRQKDIKSLEKAIAEAEAARYPELSAELRKAQVSQIILITTWFQENISI